MRSKAIVMALLAFAFQAQAVPVSRLQAESAVRAWASQGAACGVQLGQSVVSSAERLTKGGVPYYVIKMAAGGTVIASSDTLAEPIVAFSASSEEMPDLDEKSPFAALLEADLSRRLPKAVSRNLNLSAGSSAPSDTEAKWAALIKAGEALAVQKDSSGLNEVAPMSGNPGDLRVKKIVQSEWSQSKAKNMNCYNYYTPKNYVCGCVATALAQILRYYHGPLDDGGLGIPLPKNPVAALTRTCQVDGAKKSLTMQGGTYDWAKMPLRPAGESSLTEEQCRAIGKLTSDVGIAQGMMYASDGSGAYTPEHAAVLLQVFGYKEAVVFDGDTQLSGASTAVKNALFSNFDAGCPVSLSIQGDSGGHSIVADGYGFDDKVAYVHLNMGWAGSSDMWYNLPDLHDVGYTVVDYAVYNMFPTNGSMAASGKAEKGVLSGRVLDEDGQPVKNCPVAVYSQAGELVQTCVTSGRGVWSAILPEGTYDVSAISEDGEWIGEEAGISLRAPKASYVKWPNYDVPRITSTGDVGNSWGHDLVLSSPRVRFVVGDVTNVYSRLDKAIVAARSAYADAPTGRILVELLKDVELKTAVAVDFPCEIRSESGRFSVTRVKGASISVASTGLLKLEKVAFSESAATLVSVAAGGRFVLGADVSLGVSSVEIAAVRTADADGFVLAAPLEAGFAIDCAKAHGIDAPFGATDGLSSGAAAEAAAKIVNIHDVYGEIRGMVADDGLTLVWGEVNVPLSEAVGYFVGSDGVTNTAARLDRLFPKFRDALDDGTVGAGAELVVMQSGFLSNVAIASTRDFSIRGVGEGVVVGNGVAGSMSTSGFVVSNGTMTVKNLTFDGFAGSRPFVTVDGEAARLVLGRGAKFRNLRRVGTSGDNGPVSVQKGSLVIADEAEITGGASSKNGGGVYLKGDGCSLEMVGGAISNCLAVTYGGGVYAGKGASVSLSGSVFVCGNVSGQSQPYVSDNLYLASGGTVTLAGSIESGCIGIRRAGATAFADGSLSGLALETTARSFFNDKDGTKVAVPVGSKLVWGDPAPVFEHQPTTDESLAVAKLSLPDGTTQLWESVQWALQAISNETGAVTIELLKDDFIADEIAVRAKLILLSDGDKTLSRAPGAGLTVLTEASLTVADLTLKGVHADDDKPSARPLVKAEGGEVVLKDGAAIVGVLGDGSRDANAVTIWKGTFRMEGDAEICGCTNLFVNVSEGAGCGGAVLVDTDSEAWFRGGRISGNAAYRAGGVAVANRTVLHLGGGISIDGNTTLSGDASDLQVHDRESLFVDEKLTGSLGYVEGVGGDKRVFGRFSGVFSGTDADKATSARKFVHDVTGDIGAAVSNGSETLLVWGDAVRSDDTFLRDDVTYRYVSSGEMNSIPQPTAVLGLVYAARTAQVGVLPGRGYVLADNVATNAGSYEATATLRRGCVWQESGSPSPFVVPWTIAKASYDMSQVVFADGTFTFDGERHFLAISGGQLPTGVKVVYENNGQTAVGVYEVTAKFSGDGQNYEPIDDMTATLTISDAPLPPEPTPVVCKPFAFTAVFSPSADNWQLTINPAVKYCTYTVFSSDDLKTWTPVIVDQEATADGDMVFTLTVTDFQKFWQAIGKDGEKPAEGN